MTLLFPEPPVKVEAVRKWAQWATKEEIVWRNQNKSGRLRADYQVWGEILVKRFAQIGSAEIRNIDLEAIEPYPTGLEYPRQVCMASNHEIGFELRMFSRSQELEHAAWNALLAAQYKMQNPYGRAKYFIPNELSIVAEGDVINMPVDKLFDDRVDDVALFEFTLGTVINDTDAHAIGTWIERVKVTSNMKNPDGESLDSSLQLDNEVMPWV